MEEIQAIELLKNGNLIGLEALVKRYYFQAVRTSYLIVLDKSQAEDIVQSAFMNASEKIDQLQSDRFGPWFLRSVIHASIKSAGRQKQFTYLDAGDEDEVEKLAKWLTDPDPSIEEQLETVELQRNLYKALAKLPAAERAAVVRKYFLNWTESEIANDLNLPRSTVKWRLYTAREKLRKFLNPFRKSVTTEEPHEIFHYPASQD